MRFRRFPTFHFSAPKKFFFRFFFEIFDVESTTSRFGGATHFWALSARRARKMTPDELKFSSVRLLLEGVKGGYNFFSMIFGQNWLSLFLSVGNTRIVLLGTQGIVVLGTQGICCVWNTRNSLCLEHKDSLCLEHKEFVVFGTQGIRCAWSTRNLLCLKHKECLAWNTRSYIRASVPKFTKKFTVIAGDYKSFHRQQNINAHSSTSPSTSR